MASILLNTGGNSSNSFKDLQKQKKADIYIDFKRIIRRDATKKSEEEIFKAKDQMCSENGLWDFEVGSKFLCNTNCTYKSIEHLGSSVDMAVNAGQRTSNLLSLLACMINPNHDIEQIRNEIYETSKKLKRYT